MVGVVREASRLLQREPVPTTATHKSTSTLLAEREVATARPPPPPCHPHTTEKIEKVPVSPSSSCLQFANIMCITKKNYKRSAQLLFFCNPCFHHHNYYHNYILYTSTVLCGFVLVNSCIILILDNLRELICASVQVIFLYQTGHQYVTMPWLYIMSEAYKGKASDNGSSVILTVVVF